MTGAITLIVALFILFATVICIYNFLDGRDFIRDLRDEAKLSRLDLTACDTYCAQNKCQSDIIVCLTSTPTRVYHLANTLKSILCQSRRPQTIRLHIPLYSKREQKEYAIPVFIQSLQCVEVIRCEDYGPATKLLPALKCHTPEQKLLILDDDMLYPDNLIEHFYNRSQEEANIAIASSGWIVPENLTSSFTTLWTNINQTPPTPIKSTRIRAKRQIDILQGYSSYLVKPRFFSLDKIMDYSNAPEAAFYVDDVWISAHCKVPKYVLPAARFCFHAWNSKRFYKQTSLRPYNRGGGDPEKRNNTTMIRFFKDTWMLNDKN